MLHLASWEQPTGRYLSLGWRVMLIWGAGIAILGLLVSFLNHVVSPHLLYYTAADQAFTGVSIAQIRALSPNLLSWMVLFYDTTAQMMVWYGVLTIFVAATAYRRGERWAWLALLISFLVSLIHLSAASSPFLARGILENSGISLGVVGILVILAFLVLGLLLPAAEVMKGTHATPTERMKGSRKLSFGWLSMLIFVGALNIFFAVLVPVSDHLLFPREPSTYMSSDAAFSGVPWQSIVTSSPGLGLWIVLQMDNMCARMMGGGILASAITLKGFRRSARWAYFGLLGGSVIYWVPLIFISIPSYQAGISGLGAISLGFPPDPIFFLLLISAIVTTLGLVLPISHFRGQR